MDGTFELEVPTGESEYSLVAVARGFLPFNLQTDARECPEVETNVFQTPPVEMFPSASIRFTAHAPATGNRTFFTPRWLIDPSLSPLWAERLAHWIAEASSSFLDLHEPFHVGESVQLNVPAEVAFWLQFWLPPGEALDSLTLPQVLRLAPGEVKDLGDVTMTLNTPVAVQVLDERGQPVEGLPLAVWEHNVCGEVKPTDGLGILRLYVPVGRPVDIGCPPWLPRSFQRLLSLTVPEAGPPSIPYAIRLTDEQINRWRRSIPSPAFR